MSDTHIIEIKELEDGSGDSYIEIPLPLLKKMNWVEGDDLRLDRRKDGSIRVKKVNFETVELDFDEDELFKYMQIAHEKGISFNQFCGNALSEALAKAEFENECG